MTSPLRPRLTKVRRIKTEVQSKKYDKDLTHEVDQGQERRVSKE
jgi:hypothetical protein